jgi:hypothetical protein
MQIYTVYFIWKLLYMFSVVPSPIIRNENNFDAGQLTLSQYPEGPATGHLDTGFSWFPWAQERMLRWFPPFQVASSCFSCSLPDLNSVVPIVFYHTM